MIKGCPNCKCSFLHHEEVKGEHGILFCSEYCKMYFEYTKRSAFMNEETRNKMVAPVLKLPRLTISDLFSLDNEEEFTRYLNDIIAEKTK